MVKFSNEIRPHFESDVTVLPKKKPREIDLAIKRMIKISEVGRLIVKEEKSKMLNEVLFG